MSVSLKTIAQKEGHKARAVAIQRRLKQVTKGLGYLAAKYSERKSPRPPEGK